MGFFDFLFGGGGSSTTQTTTSSTTDKKVTSAGDLISLQDSTLTAQGGSIYVTSANAQLAQAAIDAAQSEIETLTNTAKQLTEGSNAIAAAVAQSQAQFVDVASGQKNVFWLVAIGVFVIGAIGYVLLRKRKRT